MFYTKNMNISPYSPYQGGEAMRRALLIGIDNYEMAPLAGCVSDVEKMASILTKNQDGSPNFA